MSKLNSQPSPLTLTLLPQSNNQVASPYFNLKATWRVRGVRGYYIRGGKGNLEDSDYWRRIIIKTKTNK